MATSLVGHNESPDLSYYLTFYLIMMALMSKPSLEVVPKGMSFSFYHLIDIKLCTALCEKVEKVSLLKFFVIFGARI